MHGLYNLSGTLYVTGKFKDKETGEESETESRNFKTLVQEADGQYNRFVLTAYERAEKFPCSVSGSYPAVSIHAHKDANTGTFEETYVSLTRKTTRFTLTNGKYKLGETTTDHSEINDYQNIILLGYEE